MARIHLFVILILLVACGQEVKPDNTYRIGRDSTWETLNLLGKDSNLLAFTDDLLYTISGKQNIKIEIENVNKSYLFRSLNSRELNAVVSFESPSILYLGGYLYSQPFFLLGPVLIVRKDSTAVSIADMKNRVVGVQTGNPLDFDQQQAPGVIFRPYADILAALRSLALGQIDGVVMESLPAYEYIVSSYRDVLKIVPPPLTEDGLRLVALKREKQLIDKFNDGLIQLIESGEYKKLIDKWKLHDPVEDYYEKINQSALKEPL